MRKPIFLDRDGVLNIDVEPYVARMAEFQVFPWTVDSLVRLDRAGFEIFVVSNQQGVSLGITNEDELSRMTEHLQSLLRAHGFQIRKFYHATALKAQRHPWRKPSRGMIFSAVDEFKLDLDGAFLIGDKWSDIEAAARAGLRPLLVLSGVTAQGDWHDWNYAPEAVFPTLAEAVEHVLIHSGRTDVD